MNPGDLTRLQIRPQDLERVVAILRQYAPTVEFLAHGSRVTGQNHEASDLDLVARSMDGENHPVSGLERLRMAFEESDLPIQVDLLDWARIPEHFRQEIREKGCVRLT
ncbi:MAG: nucleotidyltransferase domain-containing protein [Magnetococcales bacterium]|nr:nucleotidyltransferase domain-containing protein [Magnetococcales bacterium]